MQTECRAKVFLVGAGPGDPEHLTLKAVKAIAAADVILIDDLVNREALIHAPMDARVIEVGKRGGCQSTPQDFIERLMLREALAGHVVVRLKGGDPFMFGRGGEEMAGLRSAGIDVEVVPGLTAGMVAATSIGVPLTHRDDSHGVVFVTGHSKPGGPGPDWRSLAATGLTLVIYMGVSQAQTISDALRSGGLKGSTPAAIIACASLPDQMQAVTQLDALATTITSRGFRSPAIMVIGEVVRHAAELQQLTQWAQPPQAAAQ